MQINSKLRGRINVANGAPKEDIENAALGALGLERSAVKKIIIVPNRLVNIIT